MTALHRTTVVAGTRVGDKRVADMGIIEGTCLEIDELEGRWNVERTARDARRRKIHEIDELIEEFERLNLADEVEIPVELTGRAGRLVVAEAHPVAQRLPEALSVSEWMDALYDVQDTLMIPMEDDLD
jgi:hypothetical protein